MEFRFHLTTAGWNISIYQSEYLVLFHWNISQTVDCRVHIGITIYPGWNFYFDRFEPYVSYKFRAEFQNPNVGQEFL